MRRGPETHPSPLSSVSPGNSPERGCGTLRGVPGLQTVGPRDLCFNFDLPLGGDKLVMLREVLVCMDWGDRGVDLPPSVGCFGPGGRAEVRELPGPGPRQSVDKKQRSLIWSLSLKIVNIRTDRSLCPGS